jgi:hypothetical protein
MKKEKKKRKRENEREGKKRQKLGTMVCGIVPDNQKSSDDSTTSRVKLLYLLSLWLELCG